MLTEKDLKSRVGPILSDGTLVRDLIDLERREVSLRVFNDPEIHELELDRIFGRAWNLVGHVAEIPKPGDYVQRYIGEDAVIVIRDEDGEVNILLNACSHRGMEITRAEEGNQCMFTCPYHGWVFDSKGKLQGAPYERFMYGDWDKSEERLGLLRARVGVQSGLIFGNFDQNAESLDDYLGDFKYYLDFTIGDDPDDIVVMPGFGAQRARIRGNWKIMTEQATGDHYHTSSIHKNTMADMWPDIENPLSPISAALGTDKGHSLFRLAQTREEAQELEDGAFNRTIFPASIVTNGEVGGRTGKSTNLRMTIPRGPHDCEINGLMVVSKTAGMRMIGKSGNKNEGEAGPTIRFGGPIAYIGADDNLQPRSIQRSVRGSVARKHLTIKYPAMNDASDSPDGLVGPASGWDPDRGYAFIGAQRDENQWNWWRHYFDVLTAED